MFPEGAGIAKASPWFTLVTSFPVTVLNILNPPGTLAGSTRFAKVLHGVATVVMRFITVLPGSKLGSFGGLNP